MRVYQFRHIRAPRILAAARGYRHAARQPPFRIGVIPIVNRVFALLCAVGLCCLASACGSAGHPARLRVGGRAEQRGHRHPRVSARGGPHGRERPGRAHRDRPGAGALRLGAPRRHPRRADPLAVPDRAQRRGGRRSEQRGRPPARRSRACARSTPAPRTPSARSRRPTSRRPPRPGRRASRIRAPGSRSGSSTTASTRRTRTSPRPATRCRPASRRARLRTRRPR